MSPVEGSLPQMSVTRDFAEALLSRAEQPLDGRSRDIAAALLQDGIAVAALGATERGPRTLANHQQATGARADATLIGRLGKTSAAGAARVNGAAMHVLDYEPMWNPANHALSTTLPALLALAEAETDLPGDPPFPDRLFSALAIGVEAQARLRIASAQFEPDELVFHPPGVVGPIGSAVACGVFMRLEPVALTHAIGIAASRAGSLLANAGSMTKSLHCGQAAMAGLEAVQLASCGFEADADALGGPRGFGAAFFGRVLRTGDLRLGEGPLHVVEPGPAFKLYPSQYGTHFVITAALEARARLGFAGPEQIRAVRIRCPNMPYVDRPSPATGLAGKFSFQYVAAVALLDGAVSVDSFADARRFAPDIVALLPRIQVEPDRTREGRFDRMSVDVDVETVGLGIVTARCDGPPGIWGRPVPAEALAEKARRCLGAAYPAKVADEIARRLCGVGSLDKPGFRALMASLAEGTNHDA